MSGHWYDTGISRHFLEQQLAEAEAKIEAQQAEIDRLMLEYCPEEMTESQMENWKDHQRARLFRE